jgi:hypothetical protein
VPLAAGVVDAPAPEVDAEFPAPSVPGADADADALVDGSPLAVTVTLALTDTDAEPETLLPPGGTVPPCTSPDGQSLEPDEKFPFCATRQHHAHALYTPTAAAHTEKYVHAFLFP